MMTVTVNFSGDRKMDPYWKPFTTEDEFEFIRYTKAGLCLLRDKFGVEHTMPKRNVEFPKLEEYKP